MSPLRTRGLMVCALESALLGVVVTLSIDALAWSSGHRHFGSGCGVGRGLHWIPSIHNGIALSAKASLVIFAVLITTQLQSWDRRISWAAGLGLAWMTCQLLYPLP